MMARPRDDEPRAAVKAGDWPIERVDRRIAEHFAAVRDGAFATDLENFLRLLTRRPDGDEPAR
jgi:hypothetical protein